LPPPPDIPDFDLEALLVRAVATPLT